MAASMGICRLPLVVILGSTGTGKSKLAIEIGKIIGGEILSADSMQVYKGLDIITNKVTAEELSQCPHHLIDFVSPLKEFSVVEFRNMALPLIEDIKKRGKVPIIVGGTNYYIESVLWDILIGEDGNSSSSTSSGDEADSPVRAIEKRKKIQSTELAVSAETAGETGAVQGEGAKRSNQSEKMSGKSEACRQRCGEEGEESSSKSTLHEKLREVDPAMADRLHPSDSRKIARSLQVYEQHGKPHSEILQEQQQRLGGSAYGGPQRYENACVFWLQCQKEILNERLDKRVDEMLDRGLIEELLNFHQEYNHVLKKKDADSKYTEGIFQSIGFKEFHEFLVKQEGKKFDKSSASVEDKALLTTGIENMKTVTRRYAKKQMTWVRNRFLARPRSSAPDVYGLDATDLKTWETNVLKWALEILDKLMKEEKPLIDPLPRVIIQDDRHARHVCEICDNRIILGEENWKKHLKSKSHKWHVKREERNKEVNSGVINQ
ncbi:LOW QUALITY PROTEIN: tRNA dimethylallyltransferase-like [Oculina patagonica]